ncbi:MAG: DNA internalization-related competence protein ComEC/Rec2 [Legionellales bacterium]|nr:DNA internalization-related competence protein ComEC/Rec2 [Legionellales bacterium]
MRCYLIAFLGGAILATQVTVVLSLDGLAPLFILTCVSFLRIKRHYWRILLSFSSGALWLLINVSWHLHWQLPSNWQQQVITISGTISEPVKQQSHFCSFIFTTREMNSQTLHTQLHLTWYEPHPLLEMGQTWKLQVKLKRNHSYLNAGGFDYEKWLFAHNIHALGYVTHGQLLSIQHASLRSYFNKKLNTSLAGFTHANMMKALMLGDQSAISASQWDILQKTGTVHLMVIAGLHIGLVAGVFFFLISLISRGFATLYLWHPRQEIAGIISLMAVFFYVLMSDFAIPTQRAFLMLLLFLMIKILRRNTKFIDIFTLGAFLIVAYNPLALYTTGFYLSFLTVAILCFAFWGRKNSHWQWVQMQGVLLLGVFPISLYFFQQVSLISPLANSVSVPLVGGIVVPLCLLATCCLLWSSTVAHLLFSIADKLLIIVWHYLVYLSQLPYAVWKFSLTNLYLLIIVMLSIFIVLLPRAFPGKFASLIIILTCLNWPVPRMTFAAISFSILDVGQGLASVVQTAHHVLIYDAGPKFNSELDSGKNIVIPFLLNQGIKKIDAMVISHGDNDHIGGAASILMQFPTTNLLTSAPEKLIIFHPKLCHAGQHWRWDGVDFTVLYPSKNFYGLDNNSSCVLSITNHRATILLTGDIEHLAENELLKSDLQQLPSTILVAPHHGSKTSSSNPFIQAIQPHFVVFATGYLNRFHFPDATVVRRYHALGAELLNTANCGEIHFTINSQGKITSSCYRHDHPQVWR